MVNNLVNNPEGLSQVLHMLITNDNDVVHQGEKLLKPFLKNAKCIIPLIQQVIHVSDSIIKLQAALLIKRRLPKLYTKLNVNEKNQIRQQLLELLVSNQEKAVGIALGGCVSSLAQGVMVKDKSSMPELFPILSQLLESADTKQRLIAYSLLGQLSEVVPKKLMSHTSILATMFIKGCQDPISEVALEAMRSATIYIERISEYEAVMEMKPVLTPILNLLGDCLQNGDDSLVLDGLEVFQECCNMEYPLINDHIELLIPFIINIIQNDKLDYSLKQAASTTFNALLENRPKLIGKKNMVFPCLEALVSLIAKSEESAAGSIFNFLSEDLKEDEDDDDEEEDLSKVAQSCINSMAIHIPSKYFAQPALQICSQCINSADPKMRKAGCAVLGIITEGCEDSIRPLLPDVMPRLTTLCQDPDAFVRECAYFSIGQLSEYTQPDVLHYANIVLPTIVIGLDDPSHTVQSVTCYVLEQYVANLEPSALRQYLPLLVQKTVILLQGTTKVSKEIILASIASIAIASEKEFLPYLEGTATILANFLFLDDIKRSDLRGRALECLGHIAIAVGEENYQRYFDLGMRSVMQASQMDNEILKEFGYIYIANIARACQSAFNPYLESLVPHLQEVITQSELTEFVDEEDDGDDDDDEKRNDAVVVSNSAKDDDDDDDGDYGDFELNVEEGFVNTKKAAITALGALAQYTKAQFAPHLQSAMNSILSETNGSYHSLHIPIRAESVEILKSFVIVAKAATVELKDYKPVKGVPVNLAVGSVIYEVVGTVVNAFIRVIGADKEKESVANALEGIVGVLEEIGQAALMLPCNVDTSVTPVMGVSSTGGLIADVLMKQIYELLQEKAPCQKTMESSHATSHGELDDDEDHEKLVIDSVADLISAIPKYIGEAYIPYFDEFCKPLFNFAKPNRPYNSRSMVIGTVAEVILELGPSSGKYVEMILPIVQQGLMDPIEGVRRNSAYCIACIVESHFAVLSQDQVLHFLQWLQPIFGRISELPASLVGNHHMGSVLGADIDNAVSAVARMIVKVKGLLPLPQVLPVMLSALPLRVDPLEGINVYSSIIKLISEVDQAAMTILPQILQLLAITIMSEAKSINEETKKFIIAALKEYANAAHPVHTYVVNALNHIQDEEIRNSIQSAMLS